MSDTLKQTISDISGIAITPSIEHEMSQNGLISRKMRCKSYAKAFTVTNSTVRHMWDILDRYVTKTPNEGT